MDGIRPQESIRKLRGNYIFRDIQRRLPVLILDVDLRAFVHQELNDLVRAHIGGAMQRRLTDLICSIHIDTQFHGELHGFESDAIILGA